MIGGLWSYLRADIISIAASSTCKPLVCYSPCSRYHLDILLENCKNVKMADITGLTISLLSLLLPKALLLTAIDDCASVVNLS